MMVGTNIVTPGMTISFVNGSQIRIALINQMAITTNTNRRVRAPKSSPEDRANAGVDSCKEGDAGKGSPQLTQNWFCGLFGVLHFGQFIFDLLFTINLWIERV
jgi:hypothetical protein